MRRVNLEQVSKINRGVSWCVRKEAKVEVEMKSSQYNNIIMNEHYSGGADTVVLLVVHIMCSIKFQT